MNIGDKILELRKKHGFSQEDIANKLNVSRQTVSKWETNSSTPDFDKIVPLCNLFGITTDELLMDKSVDKNNNDELDTNRYIKNKKKFARGLCLSIFLYFLSVMSIILGEGLKINDEINVVIFLGIAGLATIIIIYSSVVYSNEKKSNVKIQEKKENSLVNSINGILGLVFLVIYMIISFVTMAWYITWIIWIVYAIFKEIVELLFKLKELKNE